MPTIIRSVRRSLVLQVLERELQAVDSAPALGLFPFDEQVCLKTVVHQPVGSCSLGVLWSEVKEE